MQQVNQIYKKGKSSWIRYVTEENTMNLSLNIFNGIFPEVHDKALKFFWGNTLLIT